MFRDYTVVCGVDLKHLEQLKFSYPTWIKNKPATLRQPLLVFYDAQQLDKEAVTSCLAHPNMRVVPWGYDVRAYGSADMGRWRDPQRHKMLAGFVYLSAEHVETRYWLKLDTDVIATGSDDWLDEAWFNRDPAIVANAWAYTKPPKQMQQLDQWANNITGLSSYPPLKLEPMSGSNKLAHKRINSYCGFFSAGLSRLCANFAKQSADAPGLLPVPSQDGFMWYVATRLHLPVTRTRMRLCGWTAYRNFRSIEAAANAALRE